MPKEKYTTQMHNYLDPNRTNHNGPTSGKNTKSTEGNRFAGFRGFRYRGFLVQNPCLRLYFRYFGSLGRGIPTSAAPKKQDPLPRPDPFNRQGLGTTDLSECGCSSFCRFRPVPGASGAVAKRLEGDFCSLMPPLGVRPRTLFWPACAGACRCRQGLTLYQLAGTPCSGLAVAFAVVPSALMARSLSTCTSSGALSQ